MFTHNKPIYYIGPNGQTSTRLMKNIFDASDIRINLIIYVFINGIYHKAAL